jgi:hypothetical protein
MSTISTLGPPLIGQTQNALNAILDRELAGTGLTERQWVTLTPFGRGARKAGQYSRPGACAGPEWQAVTAERLGNRPGETDVAVSPPRT